MSANNNGPLSSTSSSPKSIIMTLPPRADLYLQKTQAEDNNSFFAHLKKAQESRAPPPHRLLVAMPPLTQAGLAVLVSYMYVMMRQMADLSQYLMWRNKIS